MASSAPNSGQVVKFLTEATTDAVLLVLSGLSFKATVISPATSLLVFCSPILVPAGMLIFLVVSVSGGCGVPLSALSWICSYVSGKQASWSDQLDHARTSMANRAAKVEARVKENEQDAQNKAQENDQEYKQEKRAE